MKNLHLIPTDKPSKLHLAYNKDYYLSVESFIQLETKIYKSFNVYITNDEEIKEGDWFIHKTNADISLHKCISRPAKQNVIGNNNVNYFLGYCKKIILTTDQSLDGVQAIDDDFLEWFVNNQSCDRVEVELVALNEFGSEITVSGYGFDKFIYKIIITKEEPKQETLEEAVSKWSLEEAQEFAINKFKSEHKKGIVTWDAILEVLKVGVLTGHKFGAKWQQERMYSEEDMKVI